MKNYLVFAVFFLVTKSASAQSPGGVGTANLRGWFDAGTGVTLTTGLVSAWTDRSTIGNASQATSGERPSVTTAAINYNDALTFDGTNDNLDLIDRMSSASTGVSAYAVARQTGTGNDTWGSIFNGQANGPLWTGGGYGLVALNSANTSQGFYVRDYNTKGVLFSISSGVPFLTCGTWNGTSANNVEAFKNGTSAGTTAYTPGSVGDNGSTWLGSGDGANGNWCFYGDIAEVAIFNTGLSTTNNNKVMSYLGVKYGITLGANYSNSAGTTIYTRSGSYLNNIIGIGRDDGSGLVQRQSKNVDDSTRIYLSTLAASNTANTGSFSSDLSHVMIGADNGNLCASLSTTAEIPSGFGVLKRLDREWKVTNTNFGGTFSMDIKLASCAVLGSVTVSQLRLLIDDDGNFAAGTNTAVASGAGGITMSYANPVLTISGISTSLIASGATKFITIGSVNAATPLPIELLNFEGSCMNGKYVSLAWSTASETDNRLFTVEESQDGQSFETAGNIAGAGTSYTQKNYSFQNDAPLGPANYYRLKQTNTDGTFRYSPIIFVSCKTNDHHISVIPNPAKHEVTVSNIQAGASLVIHNALGMVMMLVKNTSESSLKLDVTELPDGVYYLTYTIDKFSEKIKLIIAR